MRLTNSHNTVVFSAFLALNACTSVPQRNPDGAVRATDAWIADSDRPTVRNDVTTDTASDEEITTAADVTLTEDVDVQVAMDSQTMGMDAVCGDREVLCNNICRNTQTDPENCGSCGQSCAAELPGSVCTRGRCIPGGCAAGMGDCDGNQANGCEASLSTLANCGACGRACAPANGLGSCIAGVCGVLQCQVGFGDCDRDARNGCEIALNSVDNCGACARMCAAPTPMCDVARGACVSNCQPGTVLCGQSCADLAIDLANCGACGRVCAPANAAGRCSAGACSFVACNLGFGDCDNQLANGCESALNSINNCRSCGTRCSFQNATATCAPIGCALGVCNAGFANCDMVAANGCETAVGSDALNCGACGNACPRGSVCSQGVCDYVTVPAATIPNGVGCFQLGGSVGKKAAIDSNGAMYLAMICGNTVSVSTSRTLGTSWTAPVGIGVNLGLGNGDYAIAPRTGGGVVLAVTQNTGDVSFTQSTDGIMWTPRVFIGRNASNPNPSGWSISVLQRGTTTLVAFPSTGPAGLTILRNSNGGPVWGIRTVNDVGAASPELLLDSVGNTIWLALENAPIYQSVDDGITFSSPGRGPARRTYSDFAMVNGALFETGANNTIDRTVLASIGPGLMQMTTTWTLSNSPSPNYARAVTTDTIGNVYIATSNGGNGNIQRIQPGAMLADPARPHAGFAGHPSIAALPRNRGVFGAVMPSALGGVAAYVMTF